MNRESKLKEEVYFVITALLSRNIRAVQMEENMLNFLRKRNQLCYMFIKFVCTVLLYNTSFNSLIFHRLFLFFLICFGSILE